MKSSIQGLKYRWQWKNPNQDSINSIVNDFSVCFPVARILYSRGYEKKEEVAAFLFSSFEKDVPSAHLMKGAREAIDRIMRAIEDDEKILIFGDYDVDGITSSSLLMVSLLPLGANINFFLPNRERDGYGLSIKAVEQAKKSGYNLIITVDNGISAHAPAARAAELGIDLIITDHHRPHGNLPIAHAIIDPQQDDCPYPFKGLPGVGVAFKIASLIYERVGKTLPEKVYELLTLGIIADVMPLNGENRFWVRHGLTKMNHGYSYALSILASNAKKNSGRLSSRDIGFGIAPQINALGRLSDPRDAVKFLISSQRDDVLRVGKILAELNEARKQIERSIYNEIVDAIISKEIDLARENSIVAVGSEWPAGVIGLVAGKLMHAYGRPALIFHMLPNGLLKGSARSIEEFSIFNALEESSDLLLSFGGHSCAAGLCLKQENLPLFKQRLEAKIARELTSDDLIQKITIDAELELTEITKRLMFDLEKLEPFGHKNPAPTFLIRNVTLLDKPRLLKDKHVKASLFADGVIKPIIFFNRPDIYELLHTASEKTFDVAASVVENEWEGRASLELQGIDIALGK